ncbi:MAG TPA: AMP-binding protein [Gordonia sp. (in: high G+C Gram-positive bacteria)]|uniref:AMP-binding protein n=1 Tax=unclassified Gordonia (in: high G+C Gram-positive bacteria) TaxID=2657482 RepID=UPI0025C2E827|nr:MULTISPECIES: AMP-binding protein [unclassified Gordonia (in: high G+C Gram-positive bacteria)]HNP55381.1 AMP-binding protein [Gordonia sp. (in: high G+C Gram-positive bacteria)]HRC50047.1 AMP-binding protein [Gordonia sp. (in: high G+C Gram-positive bacteria)]
MDYDRPVAGYPPDVAEQYRSAGYWIGQTHSAMLAESAAAHPDSEAVRDDARALTYADLLDGSRRIAHGLIEQFGLRPGDRAVVQFPNVAEYVEVLFALFDAGVLPVFALASHSTAELEDLVTRADAAVFLTVDAFGGTDFRARADHLAAVRASTSDGRPFATVVAEHGSPDPLAAVRSANTESTGRSGSPSDIAFLQLSGGTTGAPKMIGRTHDDYLYSVRESARICGLDESSVFGVVLPVSHNFTMSSPGILGALYAGSRIVMVPGTDARAVLGAIAEHAITQVSAVPPLVTAWLDSPESGQHDVSSVRVLQVGGAKLAEPVARRVPELFGNATLQQVFGMAEGLVNYTRLDDDFERIVSTQGRPISPADEIRIVDADGAPVPPGHEGSLQTRGPYTIRNYWQDASPQSFTADGFYCTGDRVVRDDAGYITVVGRDKDQINRAGEKIAPTEVEDLLLTHAAVRDASVVGAPDDRLGERIVAYVIPSTAAVDSGEVPDAFTLRGFLREAGLARFKIPDDVLIVDEFPTTAVGKISKKDQRLSVDSAAAPADSPSAASDDPLDGERLIADLADKLMVDPGDLTGSLMLADSGIDSLQLMALLDKWRAAGAAGLDFETVAQSPTIDDLVAAVRQAGAR